MTQVKKKRGYTFLFLIYTFLYLPIIILVIFSFNSVPFPSPWKEATFFWYKELFRNHELWNSFFISFTIALSTSMLCLTLGILYLYKLSNSKTSTKSSLFYTNIMIPDTVLAVSLLTYFIFLKLPLGILYHYYCSFYCRFGFCNPYFF